MTWRGLLGLLRLDLGASPWRAGLATVGIAFASAVMLLTLGLGLGIRDVVLGNVVQTLPVDMVEVVPKALDMGFFRAASPFETAPLDARAARALQNEAFVAAVYPKLEVPLPMGARGGSRLFGRALYTDLFIQGLPEDLLQERLADFHDQEAIVPMVVSQRLLDIYNGSVAPSLGAPQLSEGVLAGFEFELLIGNSLMLGARGAKNRGKERARIVGVSEHAMTLGASVPMATAERLLQRYGLPDAPRRYASILVRVRALKDVPKLARLVESMGYAIDTRAQNATRLLDAAIGLGLLFALLVLTLANLNIAHGFVAMVRERRREFLVMRALGASPGDILRLIMGQGLVLGVAGGLLGAFGAYGLTVIIDALAASWLPNFPFKPETFFVLPVPVVAGVVLLCALAAMSGAFVPAWRAAYRDISAGMAAS